MDSGRQSQEVVLKDLKKIPADRTTAVIKIHQRLSASGEGGRAASQVSSLGDSGSRVIDGGNVSSMPKKSTQEIGETPKLPPLKLRSTERCSDCLQDPSKSRTRTHPTSEPGFELGSFFHIPVGQDISSGVRGMNGSGRPSVSQGIVEDGPDLLSGFARAGDGPSESALEFGDERWDAESYDDDDDPGYHRQPIENEEWFLEHEIEYPSEEDLAKPNQRGNSLQTSEREQHDDEDGFFLEEDSYFSGEEFYRLKESEQEVPGRQNLDDSKQDVCSQTGQQLDTNELYSPKGGIVFPEFVPQSVMPGTDSHQEIPEQLGREKENVTRCSTSACRGIQSDQASSENENLMSGAVRGYREKDGESLNAHDVTSLHTLTPFVRNRTKQLEQLYADLNPELPETESPLSADGQLGSDALSVGNNEVTFSGQYVSTRMTEGQVNCAEWTSGFEGFSFPSPSSADDPPKQAIADSESSIWLAKAPFADINTVKEFEFGSSGPDDTLAAWRRQSNESIALPFVGSRALSVVGMSLPHTDVYECQTQWEEWVGECGDVEARAGNFLEEEEMGEGDAINWDAGDRNEGHIKEGKNDIDLEHFIEENEADLLNEDSHGKGKHCDVVAVSDEEEVAGVEQHIQRLQAEEDEFETFHLKIVHRKNRTGFEEDKDFPVVINSVIARRYHVTEYLGSAAFSKAIQAHDLHTGMDVCMKIIKNNKDFFDQSLDEIKLLKFINKHDPGDNHHILRLYDYFYHREHLFIVCELLRANLYEFQKYNRESGGEVYFTMPRLQSIARQCLEALEFIHKLGLIHCDLKPENILVKSYSRCEVKVIDLGSSCFQTDHLCSYVQSRSYRAPEVILGLPYSQKIDIWSLGCILAELCSGNVLFQNESLATLLARVVGILGPIDPEMLAKGRDTHKFFTKNYTLYERNQDTDQLEYLLPKKTSLAHRLPMGDDGFIDFVQFLLEVDPRKRPSACEATKHPWLSHFYDEPLSS